MSDERWHRHIAATLTFGKDGNMTAAPLTIKCDDCGKESDDDVAFRFNEKGEREAQCKACYKAMRAKEMAK